MYISAIMIIVTLLFAAACPFVLRAQSSAVKVRVTCACLHTAIFEIIAVIMVELFRVGYLNNPHVSNSVNSDIFRYIHSAVCSVLTVCVVIFVVMRLCSGKLGVLIASGSAVAAGAAFAAGGYFILNAVEMSTEREVSYDMSGLPVVVSDGLTNEYTVVALPVFIGAVLCIIFAAANVMLDIDKKWARAVTTAVNITTVAVYATVLLLLLSLVSGIGDAAETAVYIAVIIGIFIVLPPIICMCSVFSDKIEQASKSTKNKLKRGDK